MTAARRGRRRAVLVAVRRYFTFFLTMCFIISCCMILFLQTLMDVTGLELGREMISTAATLTFLNVVFLSLICATVDALRRRLMVEKPVKRIIAAAEEVMDGNLSVRIEKVNLLDYDNGFNTVIDYFNRMTEELSKMETLRADFIANVSHELKTPLAVMQNYGTMLQDPELSEEKWAEYARAITETSRNMAGMITNILKLNKLENQNIYPDTRVYDLGEQLCECLLGFEEVWEKKNLDIRTDIQEDVRIKADPELLALVWNNLFSNAVKFTEEGGTVSVSLTAQGEEAVVQVSDTGCGFGADVGEHIFEKFYQGDASHATRGNGLGLALVKRVIDITRGEISVASEVGKGSSFTVRLRRATK